MGLNASVMCDCYSKGQVRFEYPTKMVTEHRDRSPQDYAEIIEPLRTICKASIETGNPIRWC